ncbi:NAD(P)/FAD-dependent oxidoreductase [Alkalicoccus chagannorensis]|uniref:NAD(P)/FAD-dependent oxidoreductase n=1 Tax=Alkalicoccus chagannorensis TaxID=427072 RepID=UPI000413098B|nr:FAD-binding oxidoreductase [Alkalicoccus chagannorensis]
MKLHVIGGGILGASAAYHAAAAGAEVRLFDASHTGTATQAGAGIIGPWMSQRRNKAWYNMARGGAAYYEELLARLAEQNETNTGFKRVGAIHLHDLDERLQKKYEHGLKRREQAPEMGDIELLSEVETKRAFPLLCDGYRSVYVSGAARVDGRELQQALIRAGEKLGVERIAGEASLIRRGSVIEGAEVNGSTYDADITICTGGVWSRHLLEAAGFHTEITPQKGQLIHFQIDEENDHWPVVMPHNEFYLLNFGGGRVVFGATREDDSGLDTKATAAGQLEVLDSALRLAPGLKHAEILETRVGLRPFTPGFLPIFGKVPGMENLFVGDGLGASGLTSGPFLGKELAMAALGQSHELDPEDYPVSAAVHSI